MQVKNLKEEDSQWHWEGTNKNYSLGGFEMNFQRHTAKYVVEYYFPSALFVATSWVRILINIINMNFMQTKIYISNNKERVLTCYPFFISGKFPH